MVSITMQGTTKVIPILRASRKTAEVTRQ
jgi:hypothetical protein